MKKFITTLLIIISISNILSAQAQNDLLLLKPNLKYSINLVNTKDSSAKILENVVEIELSKDSLRFGKNNFLFQDIKDWEMGDIFWKQINKKNVRCMSLLFSMKSTGKAYALVGESNDIFGIYNPVAIWRK